MDLLSRLRARRLANAKPPPATDKGTFNGECQRTACRCRPATFFHYYRRQFYCAACETEISKANATVVTDLLMLSQNGEDPFRTTGKRPEWCDLDAPPRQRDSARD